MLSYISNCTETGKYREELLCKKALVINKKLVYKKVINYTIKIYLGDARKYLFKVQVSIWKIKEERKNFTQIEIM
jgi:hypothetical protein